MAAGSWSRRTPRRGGCFGGAPLPQPTYGCAIVANDVVFTSTLDGRVYAFRADDGPTLWETRMRAGVTACPAGAGDLFLVGAGVGQESTLELS